MNLNQVIHQVMRLVCHQESYRNQVPLYKGRSPQVTCSDRQVHCIIAAVSISSLIFQIVLLCLIIWVIQDIWIMFAEHTLGQLIVGAPNLHILRNFATHCHLLIPLIYDLFDKPPCLSTSPLFINIHFPKNRFLIFAVLTFCSWKRKFNFGFCQKREVRED